MIQDILIGRPAEHMRTGASRGVARCPAPSRRHLAKAPQPKPERVSVWSARLIRPRPPVLMLESADEGRILLPRHQPIRSARFLELRDRVGTAMPLSH